MPLLRLPIRGCLSLRLLLAAGPELSVQSAGAECAAQQWQAGGHIPHEEGEGGSGCQGLCPAPLQRLPPASAPDSRPPHGLGVHTGHALGLLVACSDRLLSVPVCGVLAQCSYFVCFPALLVI